MFPANSRYNAIEVTRRIGADGREIVYLRRRFLPTDGPAGVITEHVVRKGDRLDNITARYLGDPEQFWRVCDANNAMDPDELTAESNVGQRLQIPIPQGG
jgi:nucleoid-associated protein YgaU